MAAHSKGGGLDEVQLHDLRHDVASTFDFLVESFQWVGRV